MATDDVLALAPIAGLRKPLNLYTHDPGRDLVSRKLHESRVWEPFETLVWTHCQRENDVVVDAGANLGYFSLLSALCDAPAARIFAFEPDARNFHLLEANLAVNDCADRVQAVRAGLSTRDGSGELFHSADNYGDHQTYPGDGVRTTEPIRLVEGGAYLQRRGVKAIDLLKIDTQGSETQVIRGLLPLLRQSPALRMLLELTPFSLRLAGSSGAELLGLVESLGLPVFIVDHIGHRLVGSNFAELIRWSDNVAATDGDRGFMNIFVGDAPTELLR